MTPPIRTDRRGKMQPAPAAPKAPERKIVITKEQAESFARHEAAVRNAIQLRNAVLEGILAGHGLTNAKVFDFDYSKRTLTFIPAPPAKDS